MDPCRRIFGTYRDYVPSIGFTDGYITEHSGNVFADGRHRYENNLSAGTNTWLALTDNAANGTDFAYKGFNIVRVNGVIAGTYGEDANNFLFYNNPCTNYFYQA